MQRLKISPIQLFTLLLDSSIKKKKNKKQPKANRSRWHQDHSKTETVNANLVSVRIF